LLRNNLIRHYLLVLQPLAVHDIFLSLGCVEVDGQLNALGLVYSQRQIRLFLQVFQTETLKVFFSQSLGIKDASSWGSVLLSRGAVCHGSVHQALLSSLLTIDTKKDLTLRLTLSKFEASVISACNLQGIIHFLLSVLLYQLYI